MSYFKRKQIKMSLIDDYIKIMWIKNFHIQLMQCDSKLYQDNGVLKQNVLLNSALEKTYGQIFNKLKLNNLSLLILKNELNNLHLPHIKDVQGMTNGLEYLKSINIILNNMLTNLSSKLKILKVSIPIDELRIT